MCAVSQEAPWTVGGQEHGIDGFQHENFSCAGDDGVIFKACGRRRRVVGDLHEIASESGGPAMFSRTRPSAVSEADRFAGSGVRC